ncbi:9022_t:CDS:2, partial [Dentiscutata erythropus]
PIGDMQLELFNQSLFESEKQCPYNEHFNATIGYSSSPDHIDAQLNISEFIVIDDDKKENINLEEYRNIKVGEEKKRRETIAQ